MLLQTLRDAKCVETLDLLTCQFNAAACRTLLAGQVYNYEQELYLISHCCMNSPCRIPQEAG
jgi:hypothetical protein